MKIFINEKPIYLASTDEASVLPKTDKTLLGVYRGKVKLLLQFIDTFEKNNPYDSAIITAEHKEELVAEFKKLFKIIAAAGGVVRNEKDEILMIFRRGFWDLPKGKIDKGEDEPTAAVREVIEETGLQNVDLQAFITTTFHVYTHKEKRVLKPTYWYKMQTTDSILIPQTEEDIEQAIWISKAAFFAEARPVYRSIVEVLEAENA
jgi:ADP-ribose pyrophosphatase YjhB (NUDIX family)